MVYLEKLQKLYIITFMMNKRAKDSIMNLYIDQFSLPIGNVFIAVSDKGLTDLYFYDSAKEIDDLKARIQKRIPKVLFTKNKDYTAPVIESLQNAWDVQNKNFKDIKLDMIGTPFQKSVWNALLKIQAGDKVEYNKIAEMIGKPKATRAAASAIAKNPISIVVPCHRIVPKSGGAGNYAGGAQRKKQLLTHEGAL